jgi:hypothetical protein
MTPHGLHKRVSHQRAVIVAIGILIVASEVIARGDLGGRFILTYQDGKTGLVPQEAFLQHYEATLRDRLFETSELRLGLILDSRKDLVSDLTTRRYRGTIDLRHRYYLFTALITPKQRTTPLELDASRELTENRVALNVTVPKAPQLRLSYTKASTYTDGLFTGRRRELRGDLAYRYKILTLGLNRWYGKDGNHTERKTHVTGGRVGIAKAFGQSLRVVSAYDDQLTEIIRTSVASEGKQSTRNRVLTATLSGRHKNLVLGSVSTAVRRVDTDDLIALATKNDQLTSRLLFLPARRLQLELGHNYSRTGQAGLNTLLNFATIQINAKAPPHPRWSAWGQLSRRVEIEATGRTMPPNVLFLSARSKVFEGVDVRADYNLSQRNVDIAGTDRYSSSSRLEMALRLRKNLYASPRIVYTNVMDRFTVFRNERVDYRLRINYQARGAVTLGADWRQTQLTTGTQQENTSLVFNLNARLRSRSTLALTYGINESVEKEPLEDVTVEIGPEDRATTFTGQWQVWITRRGSLAFNYTTVDRNNGPDTDFLSVSFRQDF